MPISVLLVDDHTLVRQGLKLLLSQDPEISILGEAANGLEALEQVARLHPDVVLMDLMMPEMDGVTAIAHLRKDFPETEVIALTSVLEDASVISAVRNGAIGYLLKDMQATELCRSIKAAAAGQVQLAPEAASRLMRELRFHEEAPVLTEREQEVLELVSKGMSNAQIGEALCIGEKTVKTHVSRLLQKLNVRSRTQLAVHVWQKSPR
ncbi:MAG: response regulator transcription factor [Candidatus Eremiobacteraeota bacterium]|nr:response regulator transcription factor [Candidatus Eremiobacteraeota bacterium]